MDEKEYRDVLVSRAHQELLEAVERLYYAARWTADRPVSEAKLWEDVRVAAGFEPGNSPSPIEARKLAGPGPWPGEPDHRETVAFAFVPGGFSPVNFRRACRLEDCILPGGHAGDCTPIPRAPDLPHAFQGPAASGRCSYCEKALEHPIHESRPPECR